MRLNKMPENLVQIEKLIDELRTAGQHSEIFPYDEKEVIRLLNIILQAQQVEALQDIAKHLEVIAENSYQ